jgi:glycosyltransferase involved in cell wall biosynthesis
VNESGHRSRPRVALIHDWLTGMRGGEKVLEVIANLFPDAPIYTLFHFPGAVSNTIESHTIHTSFLQSYPGLRRHYRRFLPLFPVAVEDFDLSSYDVLISTSHCVGKGAKTNPDATHICYCHTPMRYVWDQQETYFPDRDGPVARIRNIALARLRRWDVDTADRVDSYVANSNFVADRVSRFYGRSADVIHPPVDTDFYTPDDRPPEAYCLMVSALSPYKRIDLAIDACSSLGLELRIVGEGPRRDVLERRGDDNMRLLGRVDDLELRELYRGASCFLQPGVEDFGISSAESLACGCPVVALGRGGILDIVENGVHGVLYDDSENSSTLAAAIDKSTSIRFNKTILRRRAETFSVASFEEQLKELLELRLPGWNLF